MLDRLRAGIDGATSEQVRTLILEVGGNIWVCEKGSSSELDGGPSGPVGSVDPAGSGG